MTKPLSASATTESIRTGRLTVDRELHEFVVTELLPAAGLDAAQFWADFERLIDDLTPDNRSLLAVRDRLQQQLDRWHDDRHGLGDAAAYESFLREIGYLVETPDAPIITTSNVDAELAELAGPQLVVPISNARFALNAANARWGSLYDALYGSDVIDEAHGAERTADYNPVRGARVIDYVREVLDRSIPLANRSHADARSYRLGAAGLEIAFADGTVDGLADPAQFRGWSGTPASPRELVFSRHGLHVIITFDADTQVGSSDPAHISDVRVEAAVSTIIDFEDSVAAVDAEDKVAAYRNWLGLNRGDLSAPVTKAGVTFERRLHDDLHFTAPDGHDLVLPGRSLLLVRNVGHLMTTEAVVHDDLGAIPEGILDAVMTSLAALPGLAEDHRYRNSRTGSIYIVKPKMHGPDEVAFADRLFARVEDLIGLDRNTIKMGVMDEERRTSVNLAACLNSAADRIVFINTGFLDRTGDEIHTSLHAGPMVRKADMKKQPWIGAYEDSNVDIGLATGLNERGQIGKGMWAMPDLMADMTRQKIEHPRAGASTAWVPSPTAAVLHALHYHAVDVRQRQKELAGHQRTTLSELLTIPVLDDVQNLSQQDRDRELANNAQSILGYVVRWIDQGVGCSKVPDIDDVALMEDRATLRISSQLLANWLHHGLISEDQVRSTFARMAVVVDRQNADDPAYRPMAADPENNIAFQAAVDLVLLGGAQPNGYTEPILHQRRAAYKAGNR
ncbi:malate synthase G [Microlunatus soli]|uniref:Malate synthase G n=1 Tax=Microlunatus soli TaxID=630515 RepID=A0A1H1QL20_9ACTN|nr:malate synthase G [Microlunatus soli]SDS24150.1 malate synthase [Microlunatus soli]